MSKKFMFSFISIGVLIGAGAFIGGHYIFEKTSTNEFCVSCHTMQTPYEEYQGSIHFSNAKGIQAQCADCHIPINTVGYFTTKVRALKDVYHEFITKKIDTPEKFEAHRTELAETVWQQMRENDSESCRSCHNRDAMNLSDQSENAQKMHKYALENKVTCIDCHKGIAHFPPEIKVDEKAQGQLIQLAKTTPATAQWVYPIQNIPMGNMGIITAATPLKVIKAENGQRTVEITGYQMQGAEQVIYIGKGQRIILASLQEAGTKALQLGEAEKDNYGNQWRKVTLTTTIQDGSVVDSQKPLWAYAEQLDNVYCSTCHAKIPAHHFTANAWPSVAKSMGERTFITKKELEMLTKYFQYNAKDFSKH